MKSLREYASVVALFSIVLAGIFLYSPASAQDATSRFLESLDLNALASHGTDVMNPALSPLRLGKTLTELDSTRDYDQPRLAYVEQKLTGVDRRRVLKEIWNRLTAGTASTTDKHLRVIKFLHKVSFNNLILPVYPDKQTVFDPLVLLKLGEMWCGQVNRIGLDIFEAAGFQGRLIQAAFHISAEVFYDDSWHLLEADILGNGEAPLLDNGTVASLEQVIARPELIDRLASYFEPNFKNTITAGDAGYYYPSYFYGSAIAYRQSKTFPAYYIKAATPFQARSSRYYGWDNYKKIIDAARQLKDWPLRHAPRPPKFSSVKIDDTGSMRSTIIQWHASRDPDGDLSGYRIFVSTRSRGWNYSLYDNCSEELKSYISHNARWTPDMYEKKFSLPPDDLGQYCTNETSISLANLPLDAPVYISIIAFDTYGESVGKQLYLPSYELKLEPKASALQRMEKKESLPADAQQQ